LIQLPLQYVDELQRTNQFQSSTSESPVVHGKMPSPPSTPALDPKFLPHIPNMNPAQRPTPPRSSNRNLSTPPQNPTPVTYPQSVGSRLPPEGATDLQLPAMEDLQIALLDRGAQLHAAPTPSRTR
jgi:hypothetical protein